MRRSGTCCGTAKVSLTKTKVSGNRGLGYKPKYHIVLIILKDPLLPKTPQMQKRRTNPSYSEATKWKGSRRGWASYAESLLPLRWGPQRTQLSAGKQCDLMIGSPKSGRASKLHSNTFVNIVKQCKLREIIDKKRLSKAWCRFGGSL